MSEQGRILDIAEEAKIMRGKRWDYIIHAFIKDNDLDPNDVVIMEMGKNNWLVDKARKLEPIHLPNVEYAT